jgi:hypothetical protein
MACTCLLPAFSSYCICFYIYGELLEVIQTQIELMGFINRRYCIKSGRYHVGEIIMDIAGS